jgi:hypothetical protein
MKIWSSVQVDLARAISIFTLSRINDMQLMSLIRRQEPETRDRCDP